MLPITDLIVLEHFVTINIMRADIVIFLYLLISNILGLMIKRPENMNQYNTKVIHMTFSEKNPSLHIKRL